MLLDATRLARRNLVHPRDPPPSGRRSALTLLTLLAGAWFGDRGCFTHLALPPLEALLSRHCQRGRDWLGLVPRRSSRRHRPGARPWRFLIAPVTARDRRLLPRRRGRGHRGSATIPTIRPARRMPLGEAHRLSVKFLGVVIARQSGRADPAARAGRQPRRLLPGQRLPARPGVLRIRGDALSGRRRRAAAARRNMPARSSSPAC